MKKALLFAGLAAAALSFVGCNKEADLAPQSKSVEIVLTDAQTRTVNDGMSTIWQQGDQLSVFFAPTGTTNWSANTKFTVQDVSSNRATGEVTLEEDAYDWYAFYPYKSQLPNPTTVNPEGSQYERSGYTTVGGMIQSQKEDDNKEHLAGKNVPVFGNVKNVPANEMPAIEMKNAASVLRFKVTNAKTENIHILSVKFFAPEDIVGTYYIDFSGTAPSFVSSGDKYVADSVTVTNAAPVDLAPDSNSEFFAVIKPFTAASGSKLKIEVEAETVDGSKRGIATKEITLTAATEFKVGYIKTLTVPFDASFESFSATTLAEAITLEDATEVELETLTVGAVASKGYVITDGTNGLYVYLNSKPDVKVGDQVNVTGVLDTYYGVRQLKNSSYTTVTEGDGTFEATWTDITANFETYTNTFSAPVKYQATVVKNGTYTNFKVEGADTYVGTLTNAPSSMFEGVDEGAKVTVYGYFSTINQTNKLVGVYAYKVDVSEAPFFDANVEGSKDVTVPASTQTVTVDVSSNVDWTAEASTGATVDPASGNGSGTITVSFPANTDPNNTKEYSVTVRTDDPTLVASSDEEAVINITQEAFDDSDLQFTWNLAIASYNTPTSETEVVWAADPAIMKAEKAGAGTPANNYLGGDASNHTSSRFYKDSKLTITPANGITIKYVEFVATSEGYATALNNSTWTNAEAAVDDTDKMLVTVTPTDGSKAMVATIGATCGFKSVTIHYSGTAKTLASIAVTGQKTEFMVGDTFTYDTAVVTATYSDNSTKNVTASATFSSPDMTTAGTKPVTVTYSEGSVTQTATYNITVSAPAANTVADVLSGGPGTYNLSDLLVYAVAGSNAIVGDSTGKILLYKSSHGFKAGDIFDVVGVKVTEYNGVLELTDGTYTKKSSDNPVSHGTAISLDDATAAAGVYSTFSASGYHSAQFVSITGNQNGRYIQNDNAKVYMNLADNTNNGHKVASTGYVYSYSSSYGNYNYQVVTIGLATDDCGLSVDNDALTWEASDTGSKTITVTTTNPSTGGFTVSPATLEHFSYTVSGNVITVSVKGTVTSTTSETLTLTHTGDASVTKTVTLTRKSASEVTDVIDQTLTGITGNTYTTFSGKEGASGAIYAGQCAGDKGSVQLRSNNSNSGVITTKSGGKVKSVSVVWNDETSAGRTLNIYGKSSAYTAATDLYDSATQGTLLGTIVKGTSTNLIITGDYEFIGFRSASGAMYITEIDITWE